MPISEFSELTEEAFLRAFSPTTLQLILMPTEKCNFRCTYCYEDFKLGRMSSQVISGVKNLVNNRTDLTRLHIMWFGGEPTVAMDVVLDVSQHFHNLCRRRDITYSAHMTTNGYLLDQDNFGQLVNYGVNDFQITLDGPESLHNSSRKMANGNGTFDRIMTNLKAFQQTELDFRVVLRIHLSVTNSAAMDNFVSYLDKQFLPDGRFSLNLYPIQPLSDDALHNHEALPADAALRLVDQLYATVQHHAQKHVHYRAERHVCYAAQPNSFIVRSNGRINKCTVGLNKKSNDVGFIDENGAIHIDNPAHARWLQGWKSQDIAFLACPLGFLNDASSIYAD